VSIEEEIAEEMGQDEELAPDDEPETEEDDGDETEEDDETLDTDTDPDALSLGEFRDKEWQRVAKYLAKNLGEIEGEDATHYVECFVCRSFGTPGWVIPGPPPVEIVGTLHEWLGMRAPDEYLPDGHSIECDECGGLGQVRMPSKVVGQETMGCVKCGSLGWIGSDHFRGNFSSPPANGPQLIPESERGAGSYELVPEGPEPPEVAVLRSQGFMVTKIPTFTS
jgi:hypothetical protein